MTCFCLQKTDEELRQNEIHILKQQLENLQQKCIFCSDKIDASIRMLQPYLMENRLKNEKESIPSEAKDSDFGDSKATTIKNEDQLVALANLKQVSYVRRVILIKFITF